MGCSSSKEMDVTPAKGKAGKRLYDRNPHALDDYHMVALTSSTYGILRLDSQKQADDASKDFDPLHAVYEKIKDIDEQGDTVPPKSWSELSNVLVKIKDEARRTTVGGMPNATKGTKTEPETETINMWELMEGVEEEQSSNMAVEEEQAPKVIVDSTTTERPRPRAGPPRPITAIHTVEELDKCESSPNNPEETAPPYVAEGCPSSEKQVKIDAPPPSNPRVSSDIQLPEKNSSFIASKMSQKSSILKSPFRRGSFAASSTTSGKSKLVPRASIDYTSESMVWKETLKQALPKIAPKKATSELFPTKSDLFDPEFLASFEEAFQKLSLDDLQSVGHTNSTKSTEKAQITMTDKVPIHVAGKPGKPAAKEPNPRKKEPALQKTELNSQPKKHVAAPDSSKDNKKVPQDDLPRAKANPSNALASRENKQDSAPPVKVKKVVQDPLQQFEKKCPPEGKQSVVFYSTSLRGIRKTFEDCNSMRSIIESFGVEFDERDVSLHSGFKQELKDLMEKPMPVPRLFIKGRYIGGAEEVLKLHENGMLEKLLEGVTLSRSKASCDGCGGVRFMPCTDCNGSCKIINEHGKVMRCTECNENGLIKCPICS